MKKLTFEMVQRHPRAQEALSSLDDFYQKPFGLEEVWRRMREAAKRER